MRCWPRTADRPRYESVVSRSPRRGSRPKAAQDRYMAFELFALTGKRALITGSSQGIGFALAQGLAEHGAEIVLNGRDEAKLKAAAATLAAAGHKVSVAGFDVTRAQA